MTITLDLYTIPEKGKVEIDLKRSFEIKITATEAQHQVTHWLFDEVSYLMRGLTPTLVLGERVVWRVPASLGLPDLGQIGVAGTVDVDVETGAMNNTPEQKAEIMRRAEEMATGLPPYQRKLKTPLEYLAKNVSAAPAIVSQ